MSCLLSHAPTCPSDACPELSCTPA
ncbi:unnamed protein product [Spirodela intermedia]|uniref:Uncharacterized protein n=2 Tax=Spirodela intermedia TaxID=51605 RepID=A0A7I8KEB0_SPIIN|nr:unnamed protein product [Spirodela intermedia]CAA6659742.1 unnamed protein product [Spirodela intermedia]CAA7396110.1 unnamed protein product [Spirodela intermedia]